MLRCLLACVVFFAIGCGGRVESILGGGPANRGDVVSYTLLRDYGEISMDSVLSYIESKSGYDLSVTSDVSLYKVTYWTVSLDGSLVKATGALAVPDTPTNPALVSYQHSTATLRTNVPSGNNDEAWAILSVFAATGNYVVSMADYLGLGDGEGSHPYMHAATEASASIDMMRAARSICGKLGVKLSDKLFLHGYSQGGHATMALTQAIETSYSSEFAITASAPSAGPHDLSGVEMPFAFNNPGPDTDTFVSYLLLSYRDIYGVLSDLSLVFKSPWDKQAPPLFDGSHDIDDIAKILPTKPSDLFTEGFLNDIFHNIGVPLYEKLRLNDLWQWVPQTKMRLYHAKSDNIVGFANSQNAYDYMHANGAPVELIDLGSNIDHEGGFYYAIPAARLWFDTLR
ncbi:MAG: hypothetical protein HONBIEJF_01047 [Fimbriimonadaceae bacterium]|nr:hypothetical protein [Fimbriimonadaceae bacterium]